jgi:hypothetical protein
MGAAQGLSLLTAGLAGRSALKNRIKVKIADELNDPSMVGAKASDTRREQRVLTRDTQASL